MRGGGVLVGRENPNGARRRLGGSFEYGAGAAARVSALDFTLDWTRIETRSSGLDTPVDLVRGLLCGTHNYLSLCFDGRWSMTDVRVGPAIESRAITYIGLAVGAGSR